MLSHLAIEVKYISSGSISSGRIQIIIYFLQYAYFKISMTGKGTSLGSDTLPPPQITARLAFSLNAETGLRLSSFSPEQARNFVFAHRTVFCNKPLFANTCAVCTVAIKAAVIWTQVLCYLHRRHKISLFIFVISRKIFYSLKFAGGL